MPQVRDERTGRYTSGGSTSGSGASYKNADGKKVTVSKTPSEWGELEQTYSDGSRKFKNSKIELTGEERASEIRMMDKVIEKQAMEKFGNNIELNKATGEITVWNEAKMPGTNKMYPHKDFYTVKVYGTSITVSPSGSIWHNKTEYDFQHLGGKF